MVWRALAVPVHVGVYQQTRTLTAVKRRLRCQTGWPWGAGSNPAHSPRSHRTPLKSSSSLVRHKSLGSRWHSCHICNQTELFLPETRRMENSLNTQKASRENQGVNKSESIVEWISSVLLFYIFIMLTIIRRLGVLGKTLTLLWIQVLKTNTPDYAWDSTSMLQRRWNIFRFIYLFFLITDCLLEHKKEYYFLPIFVK